MTAWRCAGCGSAAAGLVKTCDCPTMVGRRDGESTWLITREQDEKDRLLASAPDMLAALRDFVAHYPTGVNPFLDEAYRLAHAAIAKADAGVPGTSPTELISEWMLARSYVTGHGDTVADLLGELEAQIKERAAS